MKNLILLRSIYTLLHKKEWKNLELNKKRNNQGSMIQISLFQDVQTTFLGIANSLKKKEIFSKESHLFQKQIQL